MRRIIGYAQFHPVFGAYETNVRAVQRLAAEGARADLLVFPELALTGYSFEDTEETRRFAERFGEGPTSKVLSNLAKKHHTTLVIGYPELAHDSIYNACMVAVPDGELHNYRKIHLFSRETLIFEPGDAPPPVIDTPVGRIGLMICFDWLFPEIARMLAVGGAQIIAHPANLVLRYCQRVMYARCVENRVYSVTANRIGAETHSGRTMTFTGGSQVLDPYGDPLVRAPIRSEHLGLVEVDVSEADDKYVTDYNHILKDRRTQLYRVPRREVPSRL